MPSLLQRGATTARTAFVGGIAIIGLGRWGSSLAASLMAAEIRPLELIARRKRRPSSLPIVTLRSALLHARYLWLCVPDAALAQVTKAIVSRGSLRGKVVIHSSGVYSSKILEPAKRAGAQVASVHPLMSFPTSAPVPLAGVPFAVEAEQPVRRQLELLVRTMGGTSFHISAAGKPLYHAAAVLASPLVVSLATAAEEMAMEAGLSREQALSLLQPIMQATLHNFFAHGGAASFSGPFARGDSATVSLHLAALKRHPSLQQVYRALAIHAANTLPVRNKRALLRQLKEK